MFAMPEPSTRVEIVRASGGTRERAVDCAAVEEPLEIRLHGRPFAVIMRTPGADRELAAGFLLSEGVIKGPDDIGAIEHCRDPRPGNSTAAAASANGAAANVVNVTLTDGAEALARAFDGRRHVITNSACGMCGRLTIESLTIDHPPLPPGRSFSASVLNSLPDRLRSAQHVFAETGGLHAAGLFTFDGRLEASAEDVGRHNAVDKVVGRMLIGERVPLAESILCVSGRTSFEIIQKAFLAGVPAVVSVSAASSLAIDLAGDAGITLVGFVRGETFNIYAHPERVA
jgi:FdhD protein